MQKPISPAEIKAITDAGLRSTQVRVVIVTLDAHMASAATRANASLMRDLPGVSLRLHSVTDWAASAETSRNMSAMFQPRMSLLRRWYSPKSMSPW